MQGEALIDQQLDSDGILKIMFGRPESGVNILDGPLLNALDNLLDEIAGREEIRALLFGSAKPGMFMAGAGLNRIEEITDASEAAEWARNGQSLLQRIADIGLPTAVSIGGLCLGAGAELALAVDYRVASTARMVRIGMPEVKLGIIPCFGGSQRLPRLVGLKTALDLIISGRQIDGREAHRLGLIDLLVPPAYLEREALELLRKALTHGQGPLVRSLPRRSRPLESAVEKVGPLRRLLLDRRRRRIERKSRADAHPAPFRAIEALEAAVAQPLPQGLDIEARIAGELIPSSSAKNLIKLFRHRNALKAGLGGPRVPPLTVERVAVIGAGTMGGGIAWLAAERNLPVRLKEKNPATILEALRRANEEGGGGREHRQKLANIAPTTDDSGLTRIDLVIEAVEEDLALKREVLAEAEQRLPERAVFASCASALPVREIAASALVPERVVGLHFFNPAGRMPLVEVIAGLHSSPEAVATAHAFAVRLGKVPVVVADSPGFLVNRILGLYVNEALRLLAEGVSIGAVDRAMEAFGMPQGPFALLDFIGLEDAARVADVLNEAYGERVGGDTSLLETMVGAGRLGAKNGQGFYNYRDGRRTVTAEEAGRLAGSGESRELPQETLQDRMLLAMVNEAAICLQERIARGPRDLDTAMVLGAGFPAYRGGLMRYADSAGLPLVVDRLARFADAHGERYRPAELLREQARHNRRFYD
jgi:3-hydroxyacyl-CoA dehydrogenase/enoyl-CoA hydratase/3-hydroxybutyryl-CoA epimerase